MPRILRQYFFLLFFFFCSQAFAREVTTLVVQPLHDGANNEASDKTAEILRQKLSEETPLYVVDPQKVNEVLSYYPSHKNSAGITTLEEAKDYLGRAKEHYFQFAYAESASEIKKVIQTFQDQPPFALEGGPILLDSWITLALVHAALKQNEEALQDFQNVLKLNPFYRLDQKAFAPSIQKLFSRIQYEIQKNPVGSLEIASDPKAAEVYLNGIRQGISPLTLSPLPAGEYRLSFKANHYQSVEQPISLKPAQKLVLHPKLYWVGGKKYPAQNPEEEIRLARGQVEEGVRIADLLKADKVLWIQATEHSIIARLIDRRFRAGHNPIIVSLDDREENLEKNLDRLVRFIIAQTHLNLLKNSQAHLDPQGVGDPILLGGRRQKISKGFLYGGLGALGVGGLLAGILSAGGGGSGPQTGSLALSFK